MTTRDNLLIAMRNKVRGYDTSQLFRDDTIARIRRLELEINGIARKMNRIIEEGNLPEDLIPLPFPGAVDEECE